MDALRDCSTRSVGTLRGNEHPLAGRAVQLAARSLAPQALLDVANRCNISADPAASARIAATLASADSAMSEDLCRGASPGGTREGRPPLRIHRSKDIITTVPSFNSRYR